MVMVVDLVPGLKRLLAGLVLRLAVQLMVERMVIAFILHRRRMSCLQSAGALRSDTRHRAQIGRMLGRPSFRRLDLTGEVRRQLLALEAKSGLFLFVIDATLSSQAGDTTENTFSTGNRRRRPRQGRRYSQQKHAPKRCHSFTMGLLITPSGIRIPFAKPYLTREYCRTKNLVHQTTAQAAAAMIRELPLPPQARVLVLGDAAYDAADVQVACDERGYSWIVPCNPERVLAGPKPRPKVRSLLQDWSKWSLRTVQVAPGQGAYVAYRRPSLHRAGPKAKPRTYYVHAERRVVQSVGDVQLVFSTTTKNLVKATPNDVKILMTNDHRLPPREVAELYALRWQIELFFKELKSTLGFHQYRFRKFECVERWCELALLTFLYLEHYRARQLARRDLDEAARRWWTRQRTYGLCGAVQQATEQNELHYLAERLETPGGIRKLKRLLQRSCPEEYRAAL